MNDTKMHFIELNIFALKSTLMPRKLLFYEQDVLKNGRKFELRINIGTTCDIDLCQMVTKNTSIHWEMTKKAYFQNNWQFFRKFVYL